MRYDLKKVLLTPFDPSTINDLYFSYMNDPDVTQFSSHGIFPKTKDEIDSFIESATNSKDMIVWNIFAKEEKSDKFITDHNCFRTVNLAGIFYIGNAALQEIDLINRSAELAIFIGNKNYWKQGLGIEACRRSTWHGFQKLGLNRIYAGTSVLNKGMNKIFKKMGWKKEGVGREAILNHGELVDVNYWGILKSEWCDPMIVDSEYERRIKKTIEPRIEENTDYWELWPQLTGLYIGFKDKNNKFLRVGQTVRTCDSKGKEWIGKIAACCPTPNHALSFAFRSNYDIFIHDQEYASELEIIKEKENE